jgi:beta-N-acetylhexosaminidase
LKTLFFGTCKNEKRLIGQKIVGKIRICFSVKKDSWNLLILISFFLIGLGSQKVPAQDQPTVETWYRSMSLKQRIGQLLLVEINKESNKKDIEEIKSKIGRGELGGVIYWDLDLVEVQQSILELSKRSHNPFLFGLDCTNGFPELFPGLKVPTPAVLASISDPMLIRTMGYTLGKELRKLGLNFIIGPKISTYEGEGKYQNYFGEELQDVIRVSKPFWMGLEESGLVSVPDLDVNQFGDIERGILVRNNIPFTKESLKSLFQLNLDMISLSGLPVSSKVGKIENFESFGENDLVGRIRKEFKYSGLTLSERVLNVEGKSLPKKEKRNWNLIKQGFDMIWVRDLKRSVTRSIQKNIVKEGKFDRLEETVLKILELKLRSGKEVPPLDPGKEIYSYSSNSLFSEVWKNSIVMLDKESLLPLQKIEGTHLALLEIVGQERNSLKAEFQKFCPVDHFLINLEMPDSALLKLEKFGEEKGVIFFNISDGIADIFQNPPFGKLLKNLREISSPIVFCFQGLIPGIGEVETAIFSPESNSDTRNSIAEVIFGGRSALGRLPFSISAFNAGEGNFSPRLDRIGTGIPEKKKMDPGFLGKIDDILEEGMLDSAAPGGQVMILKSGDIVYQSDFGYATYINERKIKAGNLYDLASITKVSGTLQVIMKLAGWGVLELDRKASDYLPELAGTNKEEILVSELLVHQAGLFPYIPFWAEIKSRDSEQDFFYCETRDNWFSVPVTESLFTIASIEDSLWKWTIDSDLLNPLESGEYEYKYSDLSFYLLKEIAERITNQPIEDFLEQNFWDPMGIWRMAYNPLNHFDKNEIIPTEKDRYFRNQTIQGTVHDQGAALLGGVGGHSGIFSNSLELSKIFQMNLNSGHYGSQTYFYSKTIGEFTGQNREKNRRGLGWDKPNPYGEGPTSELCSYKTFGHSGFTGTAAWADPEFDLVYVFLSNRVYPDASNRKLINHNIRTRIQDLIYESIFFHELKEQ